MARQGTDNQRNSIAMTDEQKLVKCIIFAGALILVPMLIVTIISILTK